MDHRSPTLILIWRNSSLFSVANIFTAGGKRRMDLGTKPHHLGSPIAASQLVLE
jgi:hypothetical protein